MNMSWQGSLVLLMHAQELRYSAQDEHVYTRMSMRGGGGWSSQGSTGLQRTEPGGDVEKVTCTGQDSS